ncbi:DUF2306 domain-containing protein [Nioella aestuarii]|uniref:DUF2306 domain-containing protein n=1 Tax=Nioella aestuarii TaxID=1662864 RepID=UPI003D7F6253
MTALAPLFNAPLAVQLHVAGVLLAILLLPLTLWRRRKDRVHRLVGYVWISAMAVAALSSFFINGLAMVGPFGPIHLISVYVLYALIMGLRAAIKGRYEAHRSHLQGLAIGGLGGAGLLAFLPGRMLNQMVFGDHAREGFVALVAVAAVLLAWRMIGQPRANRRSI